MDAPRYALGAYRPIFLLYPSLKSGAFAWLAGEWLGRGEYILYTNQSWFSDSDYRTLPGIPFGITRNGTHFGCLFEETEARDLEQKAYQHGIKIPQLKCYYALTDRDNSDAAMLVLNTWLRDIIVEVSSLEAESKDELAVKISDVPKDCQLYQATRFSGTVLPNLFMVGLPPMKLLFERFIEYHEAAIRKRVEGLLGRAKAGLQHGLRNTSSPDHQTRAPKTHSSRDRQAPGTVFYFCKDGFARVRPSQSTKATKDSPLQNIHMTKDCPL